jgi:hypothetical protein
LPEDVVSLITVWLSDRYYYMSLDGSNLVLYDLLLGTVQGSILGLVLYAILASQVFDLQDFFAIADDTFIPGIGKNTIDLVVDMKRPIEVIKKWMKQSGIKINEKT